MPVLPIFVYRWNYSRVAYTVSPMRQHRKLNGHAVRALREAKGISGRALASGAYITPAFLLRLETGHRQASPETQAALAHALGVPVEAITHPDAVLAGRTH